MALEDKYREKGGNREAIRENVQGIVQTRGLSRFTKHIME